MDVPWIRLAGRVLESYERDELVAFAAPWRRLLDEFADQLAGAAGHDDIGGVLGEWLLDKDEVDEVFADDRALARVVIEQARRLAAESAAEAPAVEEDAGEPEPPEPEGVEREAWIARWSRRPFTPRTREGDGPAAVSKFCGAALLHPGEAWPVCAGCNRPMRLFVQLDLATLPAELPHPHREGMVQLFYCTSSDPVCEVDHEAWQPFGKSTLARWLSPAEVAAATAPKRRQAKGSSGSPEPTAADDEPAAVIVGWDQGPPELPGYEEEVPPLPDDEEIDDALRPRPGDKLGGWPAWVQGPEYPRCPRCKARMLYLLQLESNGLCRHQFGDLGAGHLSQCPEHPEVVAFGWACH